MSGLHLAVYRNHYEVTAALLGRTEVDVRIQDRHGRTCVHYAAYGNVHKILNIILLKHPDMVDLRDVAERTPLMYACRSGDEHALCILIMFGADIEANDAHGKTPLDYARTHTSIVNILRSEPLVEAMRQQGPVMYDATSSLRSIAAKMEELKESGEYGAKWKEKQRRKSAIQQLHIDANARLPGTDGESTAPMTPVFRGADDLTQRSTANSRMDLSTTSTRSAGGVDASSPLINQLKGKGDDEDDDDEFVRFQVQRGVVAIRMCVRERLCELDGVRTALESRIKVLVNREKTIRDQLDVSAASLDRAEANADVEVRQRRRLQEQVEALGVELELQGSKRGSVAGISRSGSDGTDIVLQARVNTLEKELAEKVEEIEKLSDGAKPSVDGKKYQVLLAKVKELEAQESTLKEQLASALERGSGGSDDGPAANDADSSKAVEDKSEELSKLRKELEHAQTEKDEAEETAGDALEQVEKLQAQVAELEAAAKAASGSDAERISTLEAKVVSLKADIKKIKKKAGDHDKSMREYVAGIEAEHKKLVEEHQSVVDAHKALQSSSSATGNDIEKKLKAAQTACDAAEKEVAELEAERTDQVTTRKQLEKDVENKAKELVSAVDELKKVKDTLKLQDRKVARLETELVDAESERDHALKKATTADARVQDSLAEHDSFRERITEVATAVGRDQASLKASVDGVCSQVSDLRTGAMACVTDMAKAFAERAEHVEGAIADYRDRWVEADRLRKKLHNQVQELKGAIRVYGRVRPMFSAEKDESGDEVGVVVEGLPEDGRISLLSDGVHKSFELDRTFGPTTTQMCVYREVEPLIESVLDGYNVLIFAYGQTGSGKTHTMQGRDSPEMRGVIPRSIATLFERAAQGKSSGLAVDVKVSVLEIYNDKIIDLLVDDADEVPELRILGGTVKNLQVRPVSSPEEYQQVYDEGMQNRTVAATMMNSESSRSHCIVQVTVDTSNPKKRSRSTALLTLIDLAGSERLKKSKATGAQEKEATHINKSLSALQNVIMKIGQKAKHIPYRDCKLTHVLQSSLDSGSAKVMMLVALSPSPLSTAESSLSLEFAKRTREVELGVAKRQAANPRVVALEERVRMLQDQIAGGTATGHMV